MKQTRTIEPTRQRNHAGTWQQVRPNGSRNLACAAWLLAALLLASPASAYHPNQRQGFRADGSYQRGLDQIDQVDLFSGRLSLGLTVGPFQLNYNSNIWRYQPQIEGGQVYLEAIPDRETNVGLGWHLGWGELYSPSHWYNTSGRWLYVGADGGRHLFYDDLHKGEDDGDPDVLYTRDNTYLRLWRHNNFYVDVEFPDGTSRRFNSFTGGLGTTYRLEKVWGPFASAADPDLQVTYNADQTLWTASDRYGRNHYIHLTDQYAYINKVITRVDLEAFGGTRAIYDFTYSQILVSRSCKDDYPSNDDRIAMPHLVRIDLPDGSYYEMKDATGQPDYYNVCENGIDDLPGVLRGIRLPTGGRIAWTFQEVEFPPGGSNSEFATSAGVAERRLIAKDGSTVGSWSYRSSSLGAVGDDDPEVYTEVVSPTGDCSKHFFNGRYWQTPSEGRGWEYGLPFVYSSQAEGMYLSTETWSGSNVLGQCAGSKLRSSFVRFRHDALPGATAPAADWYNSNRTVEASRTVFHDDGNRWMDVELLNFDGLGHFRHTRTYGNLWSGSADNETRVAYTNYNRTTGDYPGSYVPVSPSTPWVLGIHDFAMRQENDAEGVRRVWAEVDFDGTTGALECQRVYENGLSRGADDLVTVFLRNTAGEVREVKTYGGDLQTLSTAGAGCGTLPAQPESWATHIYQYGVLKNTKLRTPSGGQWPYLIYDVDLDPSTGLVATSRDPPGLAIVFDYDAMGRPLSIIPAEGAQVVFSYSNATAAAPAKVSTVSLPSGGGAALTESEAWLDDFGRLWRQRKKLPGGVWSERETLYNARGWATSVSEWGRLGKTTELRDFDAFGRPQTIRPPDGAAHDVLVSYQGVRSETRQVKVAQAGGEAYVSTSRELDRYGRLRKVLEPSGPGGATTATTLAYDVQGRLTEILSGVSPQQRRAYTYDERGFLLAETHPEKGASGNGAVTYADYDSRGLAHRKTDGPNDLAFAYDDIGRLTEVRDAGNGNRLVTDWAYDGASGRGEGKVWRATRHNWVPMGVVEVDHPVQQTFSYQETAGALSLIETLVSTSSGSFSFHQSYSVNGLGQVESASYPTCTGAACFAATGSGPQVTRTYEMGYLTGVPGWASSIEYHTSGMWSLVHHDNGVTDHQAWDPSFSRRIYRTFTTGASENFNSGFMTYDGAGNVAALGEDFFVYDPVSRLVEADVQDWEEDYTYDRFGNLLTTTTTAPRAGASTVVHPVDSVTNRLASASYDAAGNLTGWLGSVYQYSRNDQIRRGQVPGGEVLDFLYDASGERVAELSSWEMALSRSARFFLRSPSGQVLSRFEVRVASSQWKPRQDWIYAGSRPLARVEGTDDVLHHHLDALGSMRIMTEPDGETTRRRDHLPYGRVIFERVAGDELVGFSGHERDAELGGLDSMHARHYAEFLGRFLSVDAVRGAPGRPQSLNRYAYVWGNPVRFVDPDGRAPEEFEYKAWRFRDYGPTDTAHGGRHLHMYQRRGAETMARIYTETGEVVPGSKISVPKRVLKWLRKAGKIGGGRAMGLIGFILFADSIEAGDFTEAELAAREARYREQEPESDAEPAFEVSDSITVLATDPAREDAGSRTTITDASGNTIVVDSDNPTLEGMICSNGGVICVGVTAEADWIAQNEDRIQTELNAWVSLNGFEQGGCLYHPTVCSTNYSF